VIDAVFYALHAAACVADAGSSGAEAIVHAVEMQEFLLPLSFGLVAGGCGGELETLECVLFALSFGWGWDEVFEWVDGWVAVVCWFSSAMRFCFLDEGLQSWARELWSDCFGYWGFNDFFDCSHLRLL
jgi:hypothetical protein